MSSCALLGRKALEPIDLSRDLAVGPTLRCMMQLFDAVSHLHERRVVHADIKHSNVLVTELTKDAGGEHVVDVKLEIADFGSAVRLTQAEMPDGKLMRIPHSSGYTAPEVSNSRLGLVTPAIDVYSALVVCWEMWNYRHYAGQSECALLLCCAMQSRLAAFCFVAVLILCALPAHGQV